MPMSVDELLQKARVVFNSEITYTYASKINNVGKIATTFYLSKNNTVLCEEGSIEDLINFIQKEELRLAKEKQALEKQKRLEEEVVDFDDNLKLQIDNAVKSLKGI